MKKLILPILLASSFANAGEIKLTAECYPMVDLAKIIKKEYGETPVFSADSDRNAQMFFFLNARTKTYTVVLFDRSTKEGCVVDNGTDLAPTKGNSKDV